MKDKLALIGIYTRATLKFNSLSLLLTAVAIGLMIFASFIDLRVAILMFIAQLADNIAKERFKKFNNTPEFQAFVFEEMKNKGLIS